ncbi:hypothetical protein M8494_14825 [Serratia ureilytica]
MKVHQEVQRHLPAPLKTAAARRTAGTTDCHRSGVCRERARDPAPLSVSGNKRHGGAHQNDSANSHLADELLDAWKNSDDGRQLVTQQQMQHAKTIQRALFTHPSAGPATAA